MFFCKKQSRVMFAPFGFALLAILLMLQSCFAAETDKHYYRYYDAHGIANISTSVTPTHIQRGYDVLDKNMLILQKIKPARPQNTARQASQREKQSKQNLADQQLKAAYTNSQIATAKKQDRLNSLQKQMNLTQTQLNTQYQDQIICKRNEQEYIRKNQALPNVIKNCAAQNTLKINKSKEILLNLQARYRETTQEYDYVIARLKTMEK
ncbi:hypothetical protein [Acinetobacter sp. MD2(2019)]|uniref:hypothetical protein n=1 Tax=Acinetobacter sp. MD2(2019) TaxID=2605273 RepID=UPI002D1F90D1|nr:hypothetical protein [Acinetobacter sp. MD2(2019)]MEB3754847.1 hypothetical protein [Acinetobacter sp. MD2(2019)]